MKKLIFLGIITLILIAQGVMGSNVIIREGLCQSSETFIFSVFQPNDTHISSSSDFFNYSVCYPEGININFREGNCNSNENLIFGLYQPNDTHISTTSSYFNYSLCSPNIICIKYSPCDGVTIGSIYQGDNSHWAGVGYFNHTLCCMKFPGTWTGGGEGAEHTTVPTEEPDLEEPERRIPEFFSIVPIGKILFDEVGGKFVLIFFMILCIGFVFIKKKRCYYCKKKFRRKDLVLYKNRSYCKNCYQMEKAKE